MTFILLGLLAHAVADFVFQPDNVVASKRRSKLRGYVQHGVVVFTCHAVAFHLYGLRTAIFLGVAISLVHVVIDWLKTLAHSRLSPVKSLAVFVADQLAHVVTILAAWEVIRVELPDGPVLFYRNMLLPKTVASLAPAWTALGVSLDRALVIVVAYVLVIFGGATFVRQVLDAFCAGVETRLSTSAGRYIGMAERTLMLTLVFVNAFSSLAFVLTAKSLARFQELNDMRFAEYYLVGTLTSASVALVTGIAARAVFNLP